MPLLHKMFCSLLLSVLLLSESPAGAQDQAPSVDTVLMEKIETVQDAGQPHFGQTSSAAPVEERKLPAGTVEALRKDDDFWYANEKPVREVPKNNGSIWNKDWVVNLTWFLIVAIFVGILIWFLANSNLGLFRRRPAKIQADEQDISTEENIFAIQFDKEISRAVAAGNYNLAIRLQYLQVLKQMTDASIIQYDPSKTNTAYLGQLAGTVWYRDFFRLTRQFEYSWYGQFPIAETAYKGLAADFNEFKNRIAA